MECNSKNNDNNGIELDEDNEKEKLDINEFEQGKDIIKDKNINKFDEINNNQGEM